MFKPIWSDSQHRHPHFTPFYPLFPHREASSSLLSSHPRSQIFRRIENHFAPSSTRVLTTRYKTSRPKPGRESEKGTGLRASLPLFSEAAFRRGFTTPDQDLTRWNLPTVQTVSYFISSTRQFIRLTRFPDGAGVTAGYHDLPDYRDYHELSKIDEVSSETEATDIGGNGDTHQVQQLAEADQRLAHEQRLAEEREYQRRFPSGRPEHNDALNASGYYEPPRHIAPRTNSDEFWMRDDRPENKFTASLRNLARDLMPRSRPDGQVEMDHASRENNVISGREGQSSSSDREHTARVEDVPGNADIFASHREQRDRREETQTITDDRGGLELTAPPVAILERRGRTMSRLSAYRRAGSQFSPERPREPRRPRDDGRLTHSFFIDHTKPKKPPVPFTSTLAVYADTDGFSRPAPTKLKPMLGDGLFPLCSLEDPLDFGTRYSSYETNARPRNFTGPGPLSDTEMPGPSYPSIEELVQFPKPCLLRGASGATKALHHEYQTASIKENIPSTPYPGNHDDSVSTFMSSTMSSNINSGGQS